MSMVCGLCEVDEANINTLLSKPELITEFLDKEAGAIDLDKAWHGIHFLLTGSVWGGQEPLCYLIEGGEQVGDIDVGYGPARILMPDQVKRFGEALSKITVEDLRAKFNPQALEKEQIYPNIWGQDLEEDGGLGYLLEYFEILKSFTKQVGNENKGIIICLT